MEFSTEFPEYPFQNELSEEMKLAGTVLYPIKVKDNWGFIDETGKTAE